ncbi:MAG: hypothetical protein ACJAYR_002216 [Sneathiella sp.]|jgi:hypothetical protein
MLSVWIVKELDVIKHILASLFTGCIGLSSDPLSLQQLKEALGNGIVTTIAPTAHTSFLIMSLQKFLPLITGKLTPLIRVKDHF